MDFFNDEIKTIFILINTILLIVILFFVLQSNEKKEEVKNEIIKDEVITESNINQGENEIEPSNKIYVDIKGLVEKPGVYEVEEGTIINELINLAGGLKKGASTKYINLSKELKKEMVIIIYSEEELKEKPPEECHCDPIIIKECIDNKSSVIITDNNETQEDNKISINNAAKEELIKLNGIGEVKANAIIEYRTNNGLFSNIEELKNVPGITDSIYEKIKDNIKL